MKRPVGSEPNLNSLVGALLLMAEYPIKATYRLLDAQETVGLDDEDEVGPALLLKTTPHSASAHTRGGSPSSKNSTWITLGLQHTGQSSTYSCSLPADTSSGMTISSPQLGQVYAPSSVE